MSWITDPQAWIAFVTSAAVTFCALYLPLWSAIVASTLCAGFAIHVARRFPLCSI